MVPGFRHGDMSASGAAPPLCEPELGLIWRRKHDLWMSNAIPLAHLRKHKGVLGALQDIRAIAKHACSLGYRRDRFRLMLEAGAIDQTNRIMGANQRFHGAGDLVGREPL
jgi:hypothetical protein